MTENKVLYVFYDRQKDSVLGVDKLGVHHYGDERLFPTGTQDPGDQQSLERTFLREVGEEVGVKPIEYRPLNHDQPVHSARSGSNIYPYLVTEWEGDIPAHVLDSPDEVFQWETLENAARTSIPTRTEVVKRATQALIVDLIGKKINSAEGENKDMPQLYLLCGLQGSGKSTVGRLVAEKINGEILKTDKIRTEMFPNPQYTPHERQAVYDEMFRRATEQILAEPGKGRFKLWITRFTQGGSISFRLFLWPHTRGQVLRFEILFLPTQFLGAVSNLQSLLCLLDLHPARPV
jgi:hypothetical protein